MNGKDSVTIKDIARAVNASHATVSRVLTGSDYPVSAQMRAKVLEAARELNYTPNLIGRSLKTRISRDVGVIVSDISNPSHLRVLTELEKWLTEAGYGVFFSTFNRDAAKERAILSGFMAKQVCGIVLINASKNEELLGAIHEKNVRLIVVDGPTDYPFEVSEVALNYRAFGRLAAEHLLKRGRRRLAYLSAPLNKYSRLMIMRGFREAMDELGGGFDERFVFTPENELDIPPADYDFNNGIQMANRILDSDLQVDGVFANTDMAAAGAITAFAARGKSVPDDIAVVGCDNALISMIARPQLTTIEGYYGDMGRIATELLLERLKGDAPPRRVDIQPSLIVRASS